MAHDTIDADAQAATADVIAQKLRDDCGPWVIDTFVRWINETHHTKAADAGVLNHCRDLGLVDKALRPTPLGRAVAAELDEG